MTTEAAPARSRLDRAAPFVAALLCLAWFALAADSRRELPQPVPDGLHNAVVARNLAGGNGYTLQIVQYHAGRFDGIAHTPEMHGILQPFLLAALFAAFGPELSVAAIPGLLLLAGTGMLGFLYGRRLFGPGAGLLACALVLTQHELVDWARCGTDDAGFACLFLAAVMAADRALADGRARSLLLAGLVGGLAMLQKTSAIVLPIVYLAAAFDTRVSLRTRARRWLLLCAPLPPFAALYALRNYVGHGGLGFRWGAIDWIYKTGGLSAWARDYETIPELLPTLRAIGWPEVAAVVGGQLAWFGRALFSLDPLWSGDHPTLMEPGLIAPLALLALTLHWRRQPRFAAMFVLTLLSTVLLVCCVWHVEWRFFSLLQPFFAISFAGLAARAVTAVRLGRWRTPLLTATAVASVAVSAYGAPARLAGTLRPAPELPCIHWVARNTPSSDPILSLHPWRLTWYAERPSVLIPSGGPDAVVAVARRYRTPWLVLHRSSRRETSREVRALMSDPTSALSPELAFRGRSCSVYRIDPAAG